MKSKTGIVTVALALAGLLAVVAHAQFHPRHGRGMQQGGRFFDSLNLTDAQKKSVADIFASNRENMHPLMQQMRDQRKLLNEAAQKQPFDESAVRFQAQELAKVQSEMMVRRVAVMNQVSSVLTPDQRAKLQELRQQRKAQFMERMNQRRNQGGLQPG